MSSGLGDVYKRQATYGEKKSKSVIFLGDFNMGYTQKKKLKEVEVEGRRRGRERGKGRRRAYCVRCRRRLKGVARPSLSTTSYVSEASTLRSLALPTFLLAYSPLLAYFLDQRRTRLYTYDGEECSSFHLCAISAYEHRPLH